MLLRQFISVLLLKLGYDGGLMRLYDIICDKIINSRLLEMALERRVCMDKVRDLSLPLSLHLIKYYAFGDQEKNHWLTEINSFLVKISTLRTKPNSKRLKPDVYYSLLWDEPLNNGVSALQDTIELLQADEYAKCIRSDLTEYQIYEKLEKLIHKLSYDIADGSFRSIRNYKDLL